MNWYLKVLKQYADFNGRARRKEYWMFASCGNTWFSSYSEKTSRCWKKWLDVFSRPDSCYRRDLDNNIDGDRQ